MIYTPELLRSKRAMTKSLVSNEQFEAAAKAAHELRIPGAVTYLIIRDALCEKCIKAWDAMVEEFQKADADNRAPVIPYLDSEDAMRVLYMRQINVKKTADLAFINTPLLTISKTQSEEREVSAKGVALPGKQTLTTGTGKTWSMGLKERNPEAYAALNL